MFEDDVEKLFDFLKDDFFYQDLPCWKKRLKLQGFTREQAFERCFTTRQEFRTVINFRARQYKDKGIQKQLSNIFRKSSNSLVSNFYISCNDVRPGLYVEHGFSTIIYAKKIGENFHVNQCVTVGAGRGGIPVIGDNVRIFTHSCVIGGIEVGDDVDVAAGSTVVESVPPFSVVASPKAAVIKKKG